MKKFILLLLIPAFAFAQNNESGWTEELRKEQINNIHDSNTWDMERMKEDNKPSPYGKLGCMEYGAFPVPHYDLLGENSFRGVGNSIAMLQPIPLEDKKIVYVSFQVNDNSNYSSESKKDQAFFTMIMVTDTIDLVNYSTARFQISSRNHPDYVGQGYTKTKDNQVDYIAFITPEGDSYALVNMRLFHLNYGNIILVAPQKDGTIRSIQLKDKELSSGQLDAYIKDDILKREEVIEFFTNDGVI